MEEIALGAHLTTPRRGFVHHGIYAGDGRVIHYAGFKGLFRRGPVEEVTLEEFTRGHGFAVRTWAAPKFAAAARVARARSRLGEGHYRLWSNNCEHFVAWCFSGTPRSEQVEAWQTRVRNALAGWLPRARGAATGFDGSMQVQ